MTSVTFAVNDKLKPKIDKFQWINWSELAREELLKRHKTEEEFKKFNRIVAKSKLTEEDALKLGREVNASMHKKLKKLYPGLL